MNQIKNISGSGKGAGKTPRQAVESINTLQSKSIIKIVEVISEGEIVGLVNGYKSMLFDNTPVQNADDSFNSTGVTYEFREGAPDQAVIAGFSNVETEVSVGLIVLKATPIVKAITETDTDSIRVTVRTDALFTGDSATGDTKARKIPFKIEYQPNGGSYILAHNTSFSGKTNSPYEQAYRIKLTGSAPWNIKVTRISDDTATSTASDKIYFSSYTRIIEHKMIYPNTSLIGISVDSSLFGQNIPNRGYLVKGKIIQVPSNYNPIDRSYNGAWNGTFIRAWSDNPAWVLYDMCTDSRYGLGEFVGLAPPNKYDLYAIAQYCDGLISDGKGGLQPRFTFNYQITTREEAFKIIQSIASSFLGMAYWSQSGASGSLAIIQDAPKDPIKLVTNSNVIDGIFNYEGSAETARHTAVYVTWNNPANQYKPEVEVVEDIDLIARYGYRQTDIIAYGCTNQAEARLKGRWVLYTEGYETEAISYKAGIDHVDLRPGDIIKVMDNDYASFNFGGRIISASGTTIVLDTPLVVETGKTYTIDLTQSDGATITRAVTNTAGTYSTITVSASVSGTPLAYSMYIITSSSVSPRQFRIMSIKESDALTFEIAGITHDPNKFAAVENNFKIEQPSFTGFPTGALIPPTNITYKESLYNSGVNVLSKVMVSWEPSTDPRIVAYDLEYRTSGTSDYILASRVSGVSYDISNLADGSYSFRVKGIDTAGRPSLYTEINNATLSINSKPPSDVTGFGLTPLGNFSQAYWTRVEDINLSHYELRYSALTSGALWNASTVMQSWISPSSTSVTIPTKTGTYLIKAVTMSTAQYPDGAYSTNAAISVATFDALSDFNFIQNIVENPSFAGIKTNTEVTSNILRLKDVTNSDEIADNWVNVDLVSNVDGYVDYSLSGFYYSATKLDLGASYVSRLSSSMTAVGENIGFLVDAWTNVDDVVNVDGVSDNSWGTQVSLRTTANDPFIGSTNLWTQPKDLTSGVWTVSNATISSNVATAPDYSVTMDKVVETTTNSTHSVLVTTNTAISASTVYTLETIVKRAERSKGRLTLSSNIGLIGSNVFDLIAETATGTGAGIEKISDDTYRIWITGTSQVGTTVTNTSGIYLRDNSGNESYTGVATSGMFVWGLQLRQASLQYVPTWTAWQPFVIGDYSARAFDFRVELQSISNTITPAISALSFSVDMPDSLRDGKNIVSLTGGDKTVLFDVPFRSIDPRVTVTAYNGQQGDYWQLNTVNEAGFNISFFNTAGTRVARTFDFIAKGYGQLT